MSIIIDNPKQPGKGKLFIGLLLLALGIGYLLQQLNFFYIPGFLFSWPTWLIIWGLYIGARNNFKNWIWIVLVAVGVSNLLDRIFPGFNMHDVLWPVGLIAFGIWLITKRNNTWDKNNWGGKWGNDKYGNTNFEPVVNPVPPVSPAGQDDPTVLSSSGSTTIPPVGNTTSNPFNAPLSGDDYLDAVSVFGGVKKTILSKNFRGGEIVNIFGGAELDFTQADIHGRVVIDITQIFGGTKIIVPANWQVVSDLAAVFAGIDDKRIRMNTPGDTNKILVLKGVSIFAGVDIRSY